MLKVVEYGKDEYEFPALLVLGCFDAIHIGHRELIKKAKLQAKINGLDLGVMMFREGKGGKLVYSFEERLQILEQYNVKFVVAIDFTEEFKAVQPLDFLKELEDKINVKAYMSGKDFRFGAQAKGKSSTLKSYAEDEENGVWYMPLKEVDLNGERVSTTLIKSCLDAGDVSKATQLLGDEFTVTGEVVKGAGRGTTVVGYPTVNIAYPEWKHLVKYGVYSVKSTIDEVEYTGVANFGTCPTFNDERVALEVYFENFNGDLYGKVLSIKFVEYLRDIQQFENAEGLSEQLKTDIDAAASVKPEPKPVVAQPESEVKVPEAEFVPVEVVIAPETKPEEKPEVKPVVEEKVVVPGVKNETPAPAAEVKPEPAVEKVKVEKTIEEKRAEDQNVSIPSIEQDFEIDMSLIRALPQTDEEVEEVVSATEAVSVEEDNKSADATEDYSNLDSGFDDDADK